MDTCLECCITRITSHRPRTQHPVQSHYEVDNGLIHLQDSKLSITQMVYIWCRQSGCGYMIRVLHIFIFSWMYLIRELSHFFPVVGYSDIMYLYQYFFLLNMPFESNCGQDSLSFDIGIIVFIYFYVNFVRLRNTNS